MEVGIKGCVGRSVVLAKMKNAGEKTGHGAEMGVAAAGVTNPFTANTVFLAGEGQGNKGDGWEAVQGVGKSVEGRIPNPQGYVLQTEQVVAATRGASIFPRTEEEVKCERGTVGSRAKSRAPVR